MSGAGRPERIAGLIRTALEPVQLEVRDDSAAHAGHAGARGGAGHFTVRIVSTRFAGLPVRERHRLVYAAVAGMMPAEIHALSIQALTPEQALATIP
jgi:BolA protein